MTSSASALLAGLLAIAGARAPGAGEEASGSGGRTLGRALAEQIAGAWGIAAEAVRLDATAEDLDRLGWSDGEEMRLFGSGRDGWFALVIGNATSEAQARRIRAGIADTVSCAARAVPSGTRLEAADIRQEERVLWGPPARNAPASRSPIGWLARRALAAGEALVAPAVSPPPLIAAGEPVELEWRSGSVSVRLGGVALQAGTEGEVIRVRVAGRSHPLRGVVVAPGRAILEGGRS